MAGDAITAEDGWASVLTTDQLPDKKAVRAESPWGALMMLAVGERVFAIANTCTHQGAPLHRGPVDMRTGTPIATCAAHGSMFDLASGAVRRGPAMHPVAAFDVRIEGDAVQVRPREA